MKDNGKRIKCTDGESSTMKVGVQPMKVTGVMTNSMATEKFITITLFLQILHLTIRISISSMIIGSIMKELWFQILNKVEEKSSLPTVRLLKEISMLIEFKDLGNTIRWMEISLKAFGDNQSLSKYSTHLEVLFCISFYMSIQFRNIRKLYKISLQKQAANL